MNYFQEMIIKETEIRKNDCFIQSYAWFCRVRS